MLATSSSYRSSTVVESEPLLIQVLIVVVSNSCVMCVNISGGIGASANLQY
jgi:hypothetical protein